MLYGLLVSLGSLFACNMALGQAAKATVIKPDKEMTALLDSFVVAYRNMPDTKSPEKVLHFMSQELTYSIFVFNILGRSRMQDGNYKGFEGYLGYLARTTFETLRYDVSEVRVTQSSDQFGVLTYNVDYETKEEDGIWIKGKETVTMAMEKQNDRWKISHYSIVQIEDEKLKGTCLCELFASSSDEGELVASTTIPTGRQYQTNFDNFEFKNIEGETLIKIKSRPETFKRKANGMLVVMKDGKPVELGIATNKRESIGLIVRDYLYKDRCARLKMK
jgi:hypothetical protein